jgi:hypothetical protein
MIQAKFGLNWPSGFRGVDFLIKRLQTDEGRQVMAITHMTLWKGSGELKRYQTNSNFTRLRTNFSLLFVGLY